jgi:hypothetical protein
MRRIAGSLSGRRGGRGHIQIIESIRASASARHLRERKIRCNFGGRESGLEDGPQYAEIGGSGTFRL